MPGGDALTLLGMLVCVAAVLALAYLTTRLLARRCTPGFGRTGRDDGFCVLRRLNVGRSEQLLLVRVQERCLLLGVTAAGITLLLELDPEQAAQWIHSDPASGAAAPPSFAQALQKYWPKRK